MNVIKKLVFADYITLINIALGVLLLFNVFYLENVQLLLLVFLLISFLDVFDGILSRKISNSVLGKDLDSFSDFLSFGICISVLLIKNLYFPFNIFLGVFWIILSAIRLANFNQLPRANFYVGLPTPLGAFILIISFIILYNSILLYPIIFITGLSLVCNIKVPKHRI